MNSIDRMFSHIGKSEKLVGHTRKKAYHKLYNHISDLQESGSLPVHENYLGDNELAKSIYEKKYYLKNLNNDLVEKKPEDVFKRLASFLSCNERTKAKQHKWAERFYENLYNGHFVPGGRVIAGAGDLYRLKTLANCFVSQIG